MPILPIPITRYLVPDQQPTAPDGFTPVATTITQGLPQTIPLDGTYRLVLVVPTGLAITWRDAAPDTLVTTSDDELAAQPDHALDFETLLSRCPAQLQVRLTAGGVAATLPLVEGLRQVVPLGNGRLEILCLSWTITAGSMRGAGDFGSRISLAWRYADQPAPTFAPPPLNPYLLARLQWDDLSWL